MGAPRASYFIADSPDVSWLKRVIGACVFGRVRGVQSTSTPTGARADRASHFVGVQRVAHASVRSMCFGPGAPGAQSTSAWIVCSVQACLQSVCGGPWARVAQSTFAGAFWAHVRFSERGSWPAGARGTIYFFTECLSGAEGCSKRVSWSLGAWRAQSTFAGGALWHMPVLGACVVACGCTACNLLHRGLPGCVVA